MPNPDNIESPILIGGAGRSGTTWVSTNLGRHPEVQELVETGLAYSIYREVHRTWWADRFLRVECGGDKAERDSRTIGAVHQSLMAMFPSGQKRWAMKIIWGVESTWGVPLTFWRKCFPGARYIHCTRSPLKAVPSMQGHLGKFSNMSTIASCEQAFVKGHRDMLALQEQGVPYFRLRLEDVASDPVASWKSLCDFCRLPDWTIQEADLRQPQAASSDYANATPHAALAWSDLSGATLAMARRLDYEVPEGCVGRSEVPEVENATAAELARKVAKLAAENIEMRKKFREILVRTASDGHNEAAPR